MKTVQVFLKPDLQRDRRRFAQNAPGINLVPAPETLLPFYDGATAVLIPFTEGGGTWLKVLEALARAIDALNIG